MQDDFFQFFDFTTEIPQYVENYQNIQKILQSLINWKINFHAYNGSKFAAMVFRTWGQLFESPNIGLIFDI